MSELYGDWDKFGGWITNLTGPKFSSNIKNALSELGDEIIKVAQGHIDSQDIDWEPLAPYTVQKKGHGQVYLETRAYRNSFTSKVSRKGLFSFELIAGPTGSHPPSGLDMRRLAYLLEYGTPTIPPRPIWEPVRKEVPNLASFKKLMDAKVILEVS